LDDEIRRKGPNWQILEGYSGIRAIGISICEITPQKILQLVCEISERNIAFKVGVLR
jgi:hypothetical protein